MRLKNSLPDTTKSIAFLSTVFFSTALLALIAASHFMAIGSSSAETAEVDISVTISPVISLTTDADTTNHTLTIPITPDSDGNLGTGDLHINVSTNNQTGYTLTMNSQTTNTSLVHTTTPSNTVTSTTAPLNTPSALTPNHWGYWRWEDSRLTTPTTFSRIPNTTPDELRATTTPATTSNTTLTFGANLNLLQPQGHYQQTMVLTAVANYVAPPTP